MCSSTRYQPLYIPPIINNLLLGSSLNFDPGKGLFEGAFSVQTPLTSYNIWPFRINGLADPDRDISVFYIGDTNYIFPVLYNPDSLTVSYLWEQLEGDSIPLNATAENQTYAMGALGDYLLQYGVKLRLIITIGGHIHVETRTIYIISQSLCVFSSTIFTCTENIPYKLADPSCAGIISPDYLAHTGSNALCVHNNEKYTIYWAHDCLYRSHSYFVLKRGGIEQTINLEIMPVLMRIDVFPNHGGYFMNVQLDDSRLCAMFDAYFKEELHSYRLTWTQLFEDRNTGAALEGNDPLPYFPNSSIPAIEFEAGSLARAGMGRGYMAQVHMKVHNSIVDKDNLYEWEQIVTKTFGLYTWVETYQLGYQLVFKGYNSGFKFRSGKSSCNDTVPSGHRPYLGSNPECV